MGKKNVPKHFYKMGPNTPTLRNHGLGQIFHTHEKKVDSVGLDEASLELGVSSEGFVKTREGGGVFLQTLKTAARGDPKAQGKGARAGGGDLSALPVPSQ